jgi:hypothetical protein
MAGKKAEEDEAKTCSPLEEGQRCAKEGKHEEAISHFDMAIREKPQFGRCLAREMQRAESS